MNFKTLYGDRCDQVAALNRFEKLSKTFKDGEGFPPERFYSSPGRAEVLGNHTDHNHGKVAVAAISCDIAACVRKNENSIKIVSEGFAPVIVNLNDLSFKTEELGTSAALARGVAFYLKEKGFNFAGFTAYCTSNVFKGAGVSSSAAFEVLVAEIINDLYLNGILTPVEKAVAAQYAENVYFGKPCGLLDQSGIAIGSLTKLDFFNPETPVIENLPKPNGLSFVITNTGGDHAKLTPHYAAIRTEMNAVSSFFGKKVLRDVSYDEFFENLPALKRKFSGRAIMRAMHFFNENHRIDAATKALLSNDNDAFLDCINQSGISSLTLLQNCCLPGDELQPVVLGIEASHAFIKHGGVRVHGGGFAGSILAVLDNDETEKYIAFMKKMFGDENVFLAEIRPSGTTKVDL